MSLAPEAAQGLRPGGRIVLPDAAQARARREAGQIHGRLLLRPERARLSPGSS